MNPKELIKFEKYLYLGKEVVYLHEVINGYAFDYSGDKLIISYSEVKQNIKQL